jgi:hypothetical protein
MKYRRIALKRTLMQQKDSILFTRKTISRMTLSGMSRMTLSGMIAKKMTTSGITTAE